MRRQIAFVLVLVCASCGVLSREHEASESAIRSSFEPYRDRTIGAEDADKFLHSRSATIVGGVNDLQIDSPDGTLSESTRFASRDGEIASFGAAAAVSGDGYFLTVAHATSRTPIHVALEKHGAIESAIARVVWSDGDMDIALIHAELRPDAWFDLLPDRMLAKGETVLGHAQLGGSCAGELEIAVDLTAFGSNEVLHFPHDAPMRQGFSGGPAMTLDGFLIGVHKSTGMDTIFKRRTWVVRIGPGHLKRLIEQDRARVRSQARLRRFPGDAERCSAS